MDTNMTFQLTFNFIMGGIILGKLFTVLFNYVDYKLGSYKKIDSVVKTKKFVDSVSKHVCSEEINEFIKNKDVIDIKITSNNFRDVYLVMYRTKGDEK